MAKVLILFPRLDCSFKQGDVPDAVRAQGEILAGKPNHPIREYWVEFLLQVLDGYNRRTDVDVDLIERPLWQFNVGDIQKLVDTNKYTHVFIPHKEYHQFPLLRTKTLYYAQAQFPWLFSIDSRGWGSGASAYPFKCEADMDQTLVTQLYSYCMEGKSKFHQPDLQTNVDKMPQGSFIFFPCQLPHDETIQFHSPISVEMALYRTCEATRNLKMPLLVKGHPINPGSMEPLKKVAAAFDHVVWLDEINIHTVLKSCQAVVTVNSGVGFEGLLHGAPVLTFGRAEYDCVSIHVDAFTVEDKLRELGNPLLYAEAIKWNVCGFFNKWEAWCYNTMKPASFDKLPA